MRSNVEYTTSDMEYVLSQKYVFYMGNVVRMYFIQGIPYTFDELPQIIQDHPSVHTEALESEEYYDEQLYRWHSYLMEEECHPLCFELPVNDPELLPKDD